MSKSKQEQTRPDRTKRAHRDPSPERDKSWRPTDDNFEDDDAVVKEDNDVDTSKYDVPRSR